MGRHVLRWWIPLFILWLLAKSFLPTIIGPARWGPAVGGTLPNGHAVYYQSRSTGGNETDDRLTWIDAQGERRDFWVNQIHAGPSYVAVKHTEDGLGVWVEHKDAVIASLDLRTGRFRGEFVEQLPFAKAGRGHTLASGRTWSIATVILPW